MSAIDNEAVRVPVALGAKATEMVQVFFGGTDEQVFPCTRKSAAFVPVVVMLVNVIVEPPLTLVRVTTCAALVVPTA